MAVGEESRSEGTAVVLDAGTRLAYERTYLAQERTQMAWIRTALALISFGFSIAKVFEMLHDKTGGAAPRMHPRNVWILMISIGLVSLALSTLQHMRAVRRMQAACPDLPKSLSWVTATLIAVLGIAALASALIQG